MPYSDFTRIKKRVTELLNACDAGTYSATISNRNKVRNATAIEDACYEAGLKVLHKMGSFPNEFRGNLINTVTVTHAQVLPDHLGKPAFIEIQKYSDASWTPADQKDFHKINSYRENTENIYDDLDHTEEGSTLSGFYDIADNKIYFTGYACRVGLPQASRTDVLTKIPEFLESTVVKLAFANCPKAGEGAIVLALASRYEQAGMADLAAFEAGARSLPPVPEVEAMPTPHQ